MSRGCMKYPEVYQALLGLSRHDDQIITGVVDKVWMEKEAS